MTTARAEQASAWLLHRRSFRNTSLIVELFLGQRGRVGVVARGGRKIPALAPFTPLWVDLRPGRGELFTLRRAEQRGAPLLLRGTALYCGFYLNELLVRLLHRGDPHPEVWSAYRDSLAALAGDTPLDITLRRFEYLLLEQIGYGLVLDEDATARPLDPQSRYRWQSEQGLIAARDGYPGALLLAFAEGHWTDDVRRMARSLLRAALAPHLGGRPLRSRELFRSP